MMNGFAVVTNPKVVCRHADGLFKSTDAGELKPAGTLKNLAAVAVRKRTSEVYAATVDGQLLPSADGRDDVGTPQVTRRELMTRRESPARREARRRVARQRGSPGPAGAGAEDPARGAELTWELAPGRTVKAVAYNGRIPAGSG
jgi:hypothetical protein